MFEHLYLFSQQYACCVMDHCATLEKFLGIGGLLCAHIQTESQRTFKLLAFQGQSVLERMTLPGKQEKSNYYYWIIYAYA